MVERLGVWFAFLPLGIISANVGNAENIGLRNYGTGDNPVNFFIAIAANSVKQYTASFLTCSCFITRCLAQIRNSEFWPEWLRLSDELRRAYDMIKSFDFVRDWLLGPFTNNARVQENLDACFFEGKKKSTPKSIVYFFLQKQFSSAHSWNTHCYLITKCDLSICTIEKSVIYYKIIDFKIHSISLCTFKISQNGHHHFNKKINLQSCTFPLYKGVTRLTRRSTYNLPARNRFNMSSAKSSKLPDRIQRWLRKQSERWWARYVQFVQQALEKQGDSPKT